MALGSIDLAIIGAYLLLSVGVGFWVSNQASKNIRNYFVGGNRLPWYALGLSNASGMFDISGTMWMVYLLFIYGVKSIWIPWLWPTFNQIFLMMFLSLWLRRSGVMTGAEWITFRFGNEIGARLSYFVVVAFALLVVLSYLAYGFVGIGKFSAAFLPFELSPDARTNEIFYGLIIVGITSLYVVKGGMFSVVITEVIQFFIMAVASIAIAIIAMQAVSPQMIAAATPDGWASPFFGWSLDLDWSNILASATTRIEQDGWSLFSIFFMLVLFKGIMQSLAGPAPNYDMQRILSARTPVEAAKMSAIVNVVLLPVRYLLIAGLTILGLAFFMPSLKAMGPDVDFELILPYVLANFVPVGLLGIIVAGLLAAFMSSFAATVNAAPAYVVNDIYKRYINPNAPEKTYIWLSYIVATLFIIAGTAIGLFIPSLNKLILWFVSALYGGYTAANLLKWYWWRFNGVGYFCGMTIGILAALPLAFTDLSPLNAFPAMLALTLAASIVGSLLTPPTDMETLKGFYLKTRPWGLWGPVRKALGVEKNKDFGLDMFNVSIGIVWQTSLIAAATLLVLREMGPFYIALGIIIITSIILKFSWYDRLRDYPDDANLSDDKIKQAKAGA